MTDGPAVVLVTQQNGDAVLRSQAQQVNKLAADYGAKGVSGVGEPPTVVSTAAVVSALRAATGRELTRVPVRPDDICL